MTVDQNELPSAGAQVLSALDDVPAGIGVLQTIGVLLISLLMLRGTFSRGLALLGAATGLIGTVSEVLRPIRGRLHQSRYLRPEVLNGSDFRPCRRPPGLLNVREEKQGAALSSRRGVTRQDEETSG